MSPLDRASPRLVPPALVAVLLLVAWPLAGASHPDGGCAVDRAIGDGCLDHLAASHGWSGSGTADDPYVVTDLAANDVRFYYTSRHVELRGVHVGDERWSGDILLSSVSNVLLAGTLGHYHVTLIDARDVALVGNGDGAVLSSIEIRGGARIRVLDNDVDAGEYQGGVLVHRQYGSGVPDDVIVRGNRVASDGSAIRVLHGTRVVIESNTVESATDAGVLVRADDVRVVGNSIRRNDVGVDARGVAGLLLRGNVLENNGRAIHLEATRGAEIATNRFAENDRALHLYHASDSLVYDNLFGDGSATASVEGGSGNRWNVSRTPGTNVVGGPYVGGNYWSNYAGVDLDADGIGDVPHGPVPQGTLDCCVEGGFADSVLALGVDDRLPLMPSAVQALGVEA